MSRILGAIGGIVINIASAAVAVPAAAECHQFGDCESCTGALLGCVWCGGSGTCVRTGSEGGCSQPLIYISGACFMARAAPPPPPPPPPALHFVEVSSCRMVTTGFFGRGRLAVVQLLNRASHAQSVTVRILAEYPGGGVEIAAAMAATVGANAYAEVHVPFRPHAGLRGIRCAAGN